MAFCSTHNCPIEISDCCIDGPLITAFETDSNDHPLDCLRILRPEWERRRVEGGNMVHLPRCPVCRYSRITVREVGVPSLTERP